MGRFAPDARRLLTLLLAGALAGCPAEDPIGPGDDTSSRYTTEAETINAHARALNEQNLEAYVALLEPSAAGFRWIPMNDDLQDFPWLGGMDAWGIDEEIDMITNMFNEFVSPETGQSIDSIAADLEIEAVEPVSDEETLVRCHATVTVLWAENSGLMSDVRLSFLLVRGADDYLSIRSITESKLLLGRSAGAESSSLSAIKNLYRSVTP